MGEMNHHQEQTLLAVLSEDTCHHPYLPHVPNSPQSISIIHTVCTYLGGNKTQHLPSKRLSSSGVPNTDLYALMKHLPPLTYTPVSAG